MVVDKIICLKIIFSLSILVTKPPRLFVWFFHLFRANGPIAFSQIRHRLHIYSNDIPSHESCLQPKFQIKLMGKRIYYCSRHAHTIIKNTSLPVKCDLGILLLEFQLNSSCLAFNASMLQCIQWLLCNWLNCKFLYSSIKYK